MPERRVEKVSDIPERLTFSKEAGDLWQIDALRAAARVGIGMSQKAIEVRTIEDFYTREISSVVFTPTATGQESWEQIITLYREIPQLLDLVKKEYPADNLPEENALHVQVKDRLIGFAIGKYASAK